MTEPQENPVAAETTSHYATGSELFDMAHRCPLLLSPVPGAAALGSLPENKSDFTLAELYKLLDCQTIDIVHVEGTDMIFVVDDEGAIQNEPQLNRLATTVWRTNDPRGLDTKAAPYMLLFGKALLCPSSCVK